MPSGHVAAATAFFLALALFFRSRAVLALSVVWILLMGLSRMYLGRHFIADVLGGVAVGIVAVSVAAFLVRPLTREDSTSPGVSTLSRWTVWVVLLVVLAPFVDLLDRENVGRQLGLLASYALLLRIGMPSDHGAAWKRSARVLLAVLAYLVIDRLLNPVMDAVCLEDYPLGMLVAQFLITFVSFTGTILIARRLRFFEAREVQSAPG